MQRSALRTSLRLVCLVSCRKTLFVRSLHSVSIPSRAAAASHPSMSFPWCCTSSMDERTNQVVIHPVAGSSKSTEIQNSLDLTSMADWMEWIEGLEDRRSDEGGAGAYDSLRCDLVVTNGHRIWGLDFHLDRLKRSYLSLLHAAGDHPESSSSICSDQALNQALQESRQTLRALVSKAEDYLLDGTHETVLDEDDTENNKDAKVHCLKLTILWSPPRSTDSRIVVRGHACSTCQPKRIHRSPAPIVVTLAAHHHQNGTTIDPSLPTRDRDPQSKVASWCRLRKQMETPIYKPPGVSEVLMIRSTLQRMELLEGLTSNIFVVYKEGSIRTPQEGVLFGYVRHLVLGVAEDCGLRIDPRPIDLQETSHWSEAFITSSSRLVIPISKILLPEDDGSCSEFWRDPKESHPPKWQLVLNEILQRGGYPESV